MDQAPTAFLESRLNELEAENALLRDLTNSWGTKNCELRRRLRELGHPVEPFDDGATNNDPIY